ncbi:MAG TPA: M56 family metallopeptidase [Vicinamibacterales bacterium]|jgi:beta-lactamase regulating signal transducer with metallopeptidase domain
MSLSLEVAFKTTLLFLLVLGALPLLRRRSAAFRHYVLASAFACAAAIPALTLIAPSWRMPVSAAWLGLESPSTMTFVSSPQATPSASAQSSNTPMPPATTRVSTLQIVAGIWGLGAFVGVGIVMAGMWRVRRLSLHGRELGDGPWREQADEIAREFNIHQPVRLVHGPHPTLLVTWGSMQPRILLPAPAPGWSDDRIRVVLCHELAHVTRHDWMILIAANLLRSVYWFNPLVWIAYRRLRHESEQACDDLVLARGVAPADYASHLLAVARETVLRRHAWSPASAIAHPSTLEGRVRAMLNQNLNRTPLTLAGRLTAMILAIGSTIVIAGAGVAVLAAPIAVALPPAPSPQATPASAAPSPSSSAIDLRNATIEANGSRITADRVLIENAQPSATSGPGTITGVLYDQTGGLLPGVNVSLVQRPDGAGYSTVTDRNGAFTFELLPSGDYELASSLPGFSTVTTLVKVNAGAVTQRSITMPLGSLQETVTVTGSDGSGKLASIGVRRGQPRPAPEPRTFFPGGIGGQIKQPTKIVHVSPIFPPEAGRVSDVVALSARIGIDGFLSDIREVNDRASSTPPATHAAFLASALDAVRQWEFTPTLLNNVPVDVNMKINVSYNGR